MYLLDTDHITILQRQHHPEFGRLKQRLSQHPPSDFYYSVVSFHEQTLGANAYVNRARTSHGVLDGYELFRLIIEDYSKAQILPYDQASDGIFNFLRTQRIRIGTMDLRIAAIALSRGYTVWTRNSVDFSQVSGLRVEDWTM